MTFAYPSRLQVAILGMFDLTSDSPSPKEIFWIHPSFSWSIENISIVNSGVLLYGAQDYFFWEWRLKGVQFSDHCNTTRLDYYILIKRRKQCLMILNHFVEHCRNGIKIWSIFLEVQSIKFHSIHCKHFLMKHFCYVAMHWNCYSH